LRNDGADGLGELELQDPEQFMTTPVSQLLSRDLFVQDTGRDGHEI
jgi:hypothetical protein